jgi:hypothetical protein
MTTTKWDIDRTTELKNLVGKETPVSIDTINQAAEALETSVRSIASKLRKLGYEVVSMAKEKTPAFTEDEGNELAAFVKLNAGSLTYSEIATEFMDGKFTPKQIQGKILALELTSNVKPTEKAETVRTYSEAEENKFVTLVGQGKFLEDIAAALNKSINSVRGKALSMLRSGAIEKIPAQKESHAKAPATGLETLGDVSDMTVADIAAKLEKTDRGVKTMLTRRGVTCKDWDGAAKKAKTQEKADA